MKTQDTNIADASMTDTARRLEQYLTSLTERHERMLTLAGEHRAALASADVEQLRSVIAEENAIAQEVAEAERERREVLAQLLSDPDATIDQVAESLEEPSRSNVRQVAHRLRGILESLQQENEIIAEASRTLSVQMTGILRQVASRLSETGAYGASGAVRSRGQIRPSIDLAT